jgi:hypothetical protein
MSRTPRITADFNDGGRTGDDGVVYLNQDTLGQLENAGFEVEDGAHLTLCDYDGTPEEPTWLVAEGVVAFDAAVGRWEFRYVWDSVRWEHREAGE